MGERSVHVGVLAGPGPSFRRDGAAPPPGFSAVPDSVVPPARSAVPGAVEPGPDLRRDGAVPLPGIPAVPDGTAPPATACGSAPLRPPAAGAGTPSGRGQNR
ncbi:hypothetical protein GCM10009544_39250 [Streptomyces stramineus]|uniref:Uncharacterized protein n=1 Tax=Streptomyces stramineus TaxID=173861 RepID=A0ABP3K8M8_9ACTN